MRRASIASFLALAALYAGGMAIVWYYLSERWEYMAALGVPLNLALGLVLGRWWGPLFAGLALVVALPDEPSVDGVPAWVFAWYLLALPSAGVIFVGVLIRKALRLRQGSARHGEGLARAGR